MQTSGASISGHILGQEGALVSPRRTARHAQHRQVFFTAECASQAAGRYPRVCGSATAGAGSSSAVGGFIA